MSKFVKPALTWIAILAVTVVAGFVFGWGTPAVQGAIVGLLIAPVVVAVKNRRQPSP